MDEERDEYVTIYESQPETLDPTVKDENIMPAFIAYAKAGVVTVRVHTYTHTHIRT